LTVAPATRSVRIMAKQIIQRITDDLDGSADATPVQFGLDGHLYTIDLSAQNEADLRARLAPFVERAARSVDHRSREMTGRGAGRRATDHERNQALRAWAAEHGVELAARGRIANAVAQAFDANDVDALYAATGLDREAPAEAEPAEARVAETSRRRRKPEALFSSADRA
jgi:hypothetical protein